MPKSGKQQKPMLPGAGGEMSRWMRRIRRIHFVGIGGVGMGGIAEVMHTLGYQISGSDAREGAMTSRLRELGIAIHIGHTAEQVRCCDVVVVSTAVAADNVEVVAAREAHIPVVPRAQMLAELMRFRYGVAVAGTHGKTTTTSLVASLLAEGDLDPTFVIGGRLTGAGSHARLGSGSVLVAEADESDASFLCLQPIIAVVTNIDEDHMATYGGDFARLRASFLEFLHHLPFYGLAVLCVDDPVVRELTAEVARPILTYGIETEADFSARNIRREGGRTRFDVHMPDVAGALSLELNLPGHHNIANALAAIAIAKELGVADDALVRGLRDFQGIARRCQILGEVQAGDGKALLIDDYAHHPREIAPTLEAVREGWPGRRTVVVFQPHRYTRTRDLFEDFAQVLSGVDELYILEVYAAGETPISGADGRALSRAVRARGQVEPVFIAEHDELRPALAAALMADDILLTLGAGDIGAVARDLADHGVHSG